MLAGGACCDDLFFEATCEPRSGAEVDLRTWQEPLMNAPRGALLGMPKVRAGSGRLLNMWKGRVMIIEHVRV